MALIAAAAIFLLAGALVGSVWIYLNPPFERTSGVVYGRRHGQDLTLDVLQPARPNGAGIVLLVSGGWKSRTNSFHPPIVAPLLRQGHTIFAVFHVSQPKATVMEIAEDVQRAVRFVRHHAGDYEVDPQRLGITGGSAGGHLSLLVAANGGPGRPDAPDPVDRESSAVQAAAVFYPVTDLLNLGESTENPGDGGPPKSFVRAFGPQSTNMAAWKVIGRDLSPIYNVTSRLPPVLIHHGDADTLVPLDQSKRFQARAHALGRTVELFVHHGGSHGWPTMLWDVRVFAEWFDRQLRSQARVASDNVN